MSDFVLLNTRIFAGAIDLTGNANRIELGSSLEAKDATSFASSGWQESLGGLFSTQISGTGQWEANDPTKVDDETWAKLNGRTLHPWTVCPTSASDGSLAYFTNALRTSYKLGDAIGEVAPWEGAASGSAPLVRGLVMAPAGVARTASGNGTGVQIGALSTTQRMFAALHVYSISGTATPTVTVLVKSSVDNTFSSPTTRATFTAATAVGGQFLNVAGPVTDTWWKVTWTITGTNPSFLFIASLGIV